MNDFSGKYVIVTGGSKGIGKAIATNFFERGATVLICARKKEDVDAISRKDFLVLRLTFLKFLIVVG